MCFQVKDVFPIKCINNAGENREGQQLRMIIECFFLWVDAGIFFTRMQIQECLFNSFATRLLETCLGHNE